MEYRTMSFYPDFCCIGGACENSCCENWEIDLDEEALKLYKKQKGAFGKRLKDNMDVKNRQFILNGTRCPFLNEENLCDIYTEMGEACLCQTCTNFPRHVEEFDGLKEVSLTISCPEACRMMLSGKEPITFVCMEGLDKDYGLKQMKPLGFLDRLKENKMDKGLFDALYETRLLLLKLLQDRTIPVKERAGMVLLYVYEIQEFIDCGQYDMILEKCSTVKEDYEKNGFSNERKRKALQKQYEKSGTEKRSFLLELLHMYEGLENIKPEWKTYLNEGIKFLEHTEKLLETEKEFEEYYQNNEYEYEHILVYYIFNYFLGASYDKDALTKIKFAVVSYLVIFELDVAWWLKNEKKFGYEEQVCVANAYSKEVEHSYNNYEALQLMLFAHPLLSVEAIAGAAFNS